MPGDARTGAAAGMFEEGKGRLPGQYNQPVGRWPANVVLVGALTVEEIGRQSGTSSGTGDATSGESAFGQNSGWNFHNNRPTKITRLNDEGTAARYFKQVGS